MTKPTSITRFSDLVEAAAGVVEQTDLERVLRRLVTEAMSATDARYAALGIIGEHGVLTEFLYEGISKDEAAKIGRLPTGRGVLGAVVRVNGAIRLERISDHPESVGFPPHHPPMQGFLGVPVSVGGDAFGSLYLTGKQEGFTDQDIEVVEALSRIAGAAVHTARLQERLQKVAVFEDRQRIARELHDSVIQEMFAVGLSLQGLSQTIENPQVEARLLDAVEQLDRSVEALRQHIFDLRREERISRNIGDDLHDLVLRMGSAYPAIVRLHIDGEGAFHSSLDEEVPTIVTEALSNALRHSGAETVDVVITAIDGVCSIRVIDDGEGFDPTRPTNGMGLKNLRARVRRLGGELNITSSGDGTELAASIPIA